MNQWIKYDIPPSEGGYYFVFTKNGVEVDYYYTDFEPGCSMFIGEAVMYWMQIQYPEPPEEE